MEHKLGIVAECIDGLPATEALPLIKDCGFDTVFTGAFHLDEVYPIKNEAEKLGLSVETIHAPFHHINTMWQASDAYLAIYREIIEAIDTASACDIPTVVLHLSSGWFPPEICDVGLARYDAIVAHAEEKNVCVAFENLRRLGNFAYMMDRYAKRAHVGFCYDCGHEHCYTATVDMMDVAGERLLCTHIHDNHGRDKARPFESDHDEHLLPFDGTVAFGQVKGKLDEYGYKGPLTLEVFDDRYPDLKGEAFLRSAFDRLTKIAKM